MDLLKFKLIMPLKLDTAEALKILLSLSTHGTVLNQTKMKKYRISFQN